MRPQHLAVGILLLEAAVVVAALVAEAAVAVVVAVTSVVVVVTLWMILCFQISLFSCFLKKRSRRTDGQTYGPMDGRTYGRKDRPFYRSHEERLHTAQTQFQNSFEV